MEEKILNITKLYELIEKDVKDYEEKKKNGDLFIPRILIEDKELIYLEKIYLAIYFMNKKDCKITDEIFLKSNSYYQLRTTKKSLIKKEYLSKCEESPYSLKEKTIAFSKKGKECEWCHNKSYVLQQHHFPISKKDGGKEIVNICPNCHCTYHELERNSYE